MPSESQLNPKASGTRNDRSVALPEQDGYAGPRDAASLGTWDIIGIGTRNVVLVQVKTRYWLGFAETEALGNRPAAATFQKQSIGGVIASGLLTPPSRLSLQNFLRACQELVVSPVTAIHDKLAQRPKWVAEFPVRRRVA